MIRHSFLLLVLLFPLLSAAAFTDHFTKASLRLDYYHSGDAQHELVTFAALKWEPVYGGSQTNLVDTFDYGQYMVRVEEKATGKLIYSRGYCTLFNEWRTTDEAKKLKRSFRESVVCPFPLMEVNVRIMARDSLACWYELFSMEVNPKSVMISYEPIIDVDTVCIHRGGDPSSQVDVVFLAEGYTKWEMDKFIEDCKRFKSYLLGAQPFKDHMADFNIWAVMAQSQSSGTDKPTRGRWKNTVFSSHFNTFGTERYLTCDDYWTIRDYVAAVPCDQIVLMVNDDEYGGGGIYNFMTVATVDSKSADFLLIHEFGHAFAGLGDEYYTSDVAVEDFYPAHIEPWEPNITTLVDFDTKWKDMLDPTTPIPTKVDKDNINKLGVFEGAGYKAEGVYRPRYDCTMKSVRYDYFCPVCQRAMVRMIDFYSHE